MVEECHSSVHIERPRRRTSLFREIDTRERRRSVRNQSSRSIDDRTIRHLLRERCNRILPHKPHQHSHSHSIFEALRRTKSENRVDFPPCALVLSPAIASLTCPTVCLISCFAFSVKADSVSDPGFADTPPVAYSLLPFHPAIPAYRAGDWARSEVGRAN